MPLYSKSKLKTFTKIQRGSITIQYMLTLQLYTHSKDLEWERTNCTLFQSICTHCKSILSHIVFSQWNSTNTFTYINDY